MHKHKTCVLLKNLNKMVELFMFKYKLQGNLQLIARVISFIPVKLIISEKLLYEIFENNAF